MRPLQVYKMRTRLLVCLLLLFLPKFSESCLPSWFRQERSADPLQNLTSSDAPTPPTSDSASESPTPSITKSGLETNEIGDPSTSSDEDPIPTPPALPTPSEDSEDVEEEDEFEYIDEEKAEEEEEALKYNEDVKKTEEVTQKTSHHLEMEHMKAEKCKDYCHHNATCHAEVITRDGRVVAVVPSCHCPHGWEGTRCDRRYVQAFYAPVHGKYNGKSGKYKIYAVKPPNSTVSTTPTTTTTESPFLAVFTDFYAQIVQGSSSAVPAFAFLLIMLFMFLAIVFYAYRRMSKRSDDMTYTMSHMCPPEAFTVLKTPNGRPLAVIPNTVTSTTSSGVPRAPMRHTAVRNVDSSARNNFFSILRSQGTIPSRNLNDDDTPKHYKSVPRVEVSAINYSGHIDFSTVSFQSSSSEVSKASATCPPPLPHVVIEMEEQHFRSPSRSAGEPSTPTTSEPMIPPKLP